MFVRFLTGRRKGEVAEMKFVDAKALVDDGRAERAYQDPPAEQSSVEAKPGSNAAQAEKHKKGRRK